MGRAQGGDVEDHQHMRLTRCHRPCGGGAISKPWGIYGTLQQCESSAIPVRVLWAFFLTVTQALFVQDVVVSYQLHVRRRVYVQPYQSFLPLFKCLIFTF